MALVKESMRSQQTSLAQLAHELETLRSSVDKVKEFLGYVDTSYNSLNRLKREVELIIADDAAFPKAFNQSFFKKYTL